MKRHLLSALIFSLALAGVARAQELHLHLAPDEVGPRYSLTPPTFGEAKLVEKLAALLDDEDPITREQAVLALGQCHNQLAQPAIEKAMADQAANVRCAAVEAAAQMPLEQARKLLAKALADSETKVQLAALDVTVQLDIKDLAAQMAKLLDSPDNFVAAQAMGALTAVGVEAPQASVSGMLGAEYQLGQIKALEQIARTGKASSAAADQVFALLDATRPALAGAAIEAAARLNAKRLADRISQASKSPSPLLRRAAARAAVHAGQADIVRSAMDDKSAMVRLAAVKAAGELKDADSVAKLFDILKTTPDLQTHLAARQSLRQIARPAVAQRAAEILNDLHGTSRDANEYKAIMEIRQMQAAAWLLGQLKSEAALPVMLSMVSSLQINSPLLQEVVLALAQIGNDQAVVPLLALVKKCLQTAPAHLRALQSPNPSNGPPFSESVMAAAIEALAKLDAPAAVSVAVQTISVKVQDMRLEVPAAASGALLASLEAPPTQDISPALNLLLDANLWGNPTGPFYAAKAAGKLKQDKCLAALENLLNVQRPGLQTMDAAADAIGQLTGKRPAVGDPAAREGQWIIQTNTSRR